MGGSVDANLKLFSLPIWLIFALVPVEVEPFFCLEGTVCMVGAVFFLKAQAD